ncbi:MAG: Unknown protein [uncultured Sulfurovum sp.]|uniref:Glycosyltransferase RgtA/B/C/D-like domain-containing protein n=1 Tax=uncultured Sulfurovum sp. TaxID=269237 RepID=A0A6S6SVK1_9BACT|nr:MAG: Unknown protein [uncultured Sulfurovum sp.]
MDKSYIPMMDVWGVVLAPIYIIILTSVLIKINNSMKAGFSSRVIASLFLYYYLFFLVGTLNPLIPDFPDTRLFSLIISENYFPPDQSLGVRLFYYITYPFRIISLFKIELFILFQLFIFIISLMVLWKSWQIVLEKNNYSKSLGVHVFLTLTAVYPAFLLYMPIPLREFFILFGFSVMVYGLIDKYYNNNGLMYIVLGSILLLFGRPQLIVIVIIFFALFQKTKWIKYTLVVGSIFVIPVLFTTILSFKFTPDFFEYIRNGSFNKYYPMSYGEVEWNTYVDILKDMPSLLMQFLLSPLPLLHDMNPIHYLAVFMDAIFLIIVYIAVIYAGIRVSKVYVFIFILAASIFSIWEFHITGAARHRMPLVMIMLPVASYGLLKMYQDIKAKI